MFLIQVDQAFFHTIFVALAWLSIKKITLITGKNMETLTQQCAKRGNELLKVY